MQIQTTVITIFIVFLIFYAVFTFFVTTPISQNVRVSSAGNLVVSQVFAENRNCGLRALKGVESPQMFWDSMREVLNDCFVNSPTNAIGINAYANKEEKKYHIKSATATQEVIVTIGVGGDIDAELALKEDSTEEQVFFGADPVVEENDRVFSAIGTFLPFAVGARTGFDTSKIFKDGTYKDEEVVQVDLITFIRNFVSRTFIDDIWIDAEGQEYDMFPMFFRGGELDRNGITLCQINLEVHNPDDEKKKMVQAFILRILEEARYSILRVQQSNDLRVFLFNSANNRCVDKFVEQFFVD